MRWVAVILLVLASPAFAQSAGSVLQSGPVTPGHGVKWITNGVIGDSGSVPGGGGGGSIPFPTPSTLGGMFSSSTAPHQWVDSILTSGHVHTSRPACSDLSNASPSCAIDATNASNLTSGLLPPDRLTRSGNTGVVATVSGPLVSGNCVIADASGNLVDGDGNCGGGPPPVSNCILLQGGGGCLQLQAGAGDILLQ